MIQFSEEISVNYGLPVLFFFSFFPHSYYNIHICHVVFHLFAFLYNAQVILVNFFGVNYMRETGSLLAQLGVPKTSQFWK